MNNVTLKIIVDKGREYDFIEHCNVWGIQYKQYPTPVTWAFKVIIYEHLVEHLLGEIDYIKIEPMPTIVLD